MNAPGRKKIETILARQRESGREKRRLRAQIGFIRETVRHTNEKESCLSINEMGWDRQRPMGGMGKEDQLTNQRLLQWKKWRSSYIIVVFVVVVSSWDYRLPGAERHNFNVINDEYAIWPTAYCVSHAAAKGWQSSSIVWSPQTSHVFWIESHIMGILRRDLAMIRHWCKGAGKSEGMILIAFIDHGESPPRGEKDWRGGWNFHNCLDFDKIFSPHWSLLNEGGGGQSSWVCDSPSFVSLSSSWFFFLVTHKLYPVSYQESLKKG